MNLTPPTTAYREKKEIIRTEAKYIFLLRKLMSLSDGRSLITVTKDGESLDLTVLELGKVERIK